MNLKEDPGMGPVCPRCGSFDVEIVEMNARTHQATFHCEDCELRWTEEEGA